MADDDERERQTEPEITSEENAIEEDELELSLGLRPVHPRPRFVASSLLSKRDVQALRRQEAKKKRDLKRKANNTRACLAAEEREGNSGDWQPLDDAGKCRKAPKINASYWAPPSWWSWNPAAGAGEGFRPYQGQNGKFNPGMQNGEAKDCENRQSISSGSSSGISDNYQSTSGPGGTSSDVGSHSSHPYSQPSPPTIPTGSPCRVSQGELEPNGSNRDQTEPTMSSRRSSKPFDNGPSSDKGPISATPNPGPKEVKVEKGKPPKPTGPTTNQPKELTLAQMPCVSVTGNGPNGKTITGFLYRYTKGEVSIVCVCHGTSFSPAGFVEHAGGADVENPLRHIRVVPFALG